MKAIIVGGGVIGMMQARELVLKGHDVVLVDKGVTGAEASWAGGGIVSPLYPWRYSDPVTALATWSQSYYPNLIESLEAESGIDPELTRHGLLMLSVQDEAQALEWSNVNQRWLELIDAEAIYKLEPLLRPGFGKALWMSQVASVRNPRLLKALRGALEASERARFHESDGARELIQHGDEVKGIKTIAGEELYGDCVIVCAGAWSPELIPDFTVSIEPVKGQMLLFEASKNLVNRIVLHDGRYVIPRRDGSVIAGSTLEYKGFDKATTSTAKEELADMAIDLFPELSRCAIRHHWSGLRPGTPDGIPYIGAVPGLNNLYLNAGHFRNGLVLAPASVRLMTSLLCDEQPPVDPRPYDPALRNSHQRTIA